MTSSTTTTRSPGSSTKPRRSTIPPSWRSVKSPRTPNARATSCATSTPPRAGATTTDGGAGSTSRRDAASPAQSRVASAGSISTRAHWT